MAKGLMTISISQEVRAKLDKCENKSALIESLLSQHFEMSRKLTKAEIQKRKEVLAIEIESLKKIQEIENGKSE